MDHGGTIVRGIYSLFHTVGDKARDPNPKYLREAFCREGCRGGSPTHPLLESATTMAGPRRLSVLVHKIRLVSLKSVVQDIGRAYIKNRHRDEWIAVASW